MSRVVLKVGGSLLARRDLASRLGRYLRQWEGDETLIVVGGGEAADVVRDWGSIHNLTDEAAHWVAIRSLSVTRCLVKSLLNDLEEVSTVEEATHRWSLSRRPLMLDVEGFLAEQELTSPEPLPHTWDVTSDSIAARVAICCSADELVLVKSVGLAPGTDSASAAAQELVDAHFPAIADQVPRIGWCNLLDESFQTQPWLKFGKMVPPIPTTPRVA